MDLAVDLIYMPIEGITILVEHHDMQICANCYDYFIYYVNGADVLHVPVPN